MKRGAKGVRRAGEERTATKNLQILCLLHAQAVVAGQVGAKLNHAMLRERPVGGCAVAREQGVLVLGVEVNGGCESVVGSDVGLAQLRRLGSLTGANGGRDLKVDHVVAVADESLHNLGGVGEWYGRANV
jgi:hypothetical protein